MTIVDGNGANIVTVKNGEVIYYNNYGMGDALVMTDGDFKAFFVVLATERCRCRTLFGKIFIEFL
jgi:hypothetical protein